jgi:hypothetical protein
VRDAAKSHRDERGKNIVFAAKRHRRASAIGATQGLIFLFSFHH